MRKWELVGGKGSEWEEKEVSRRKWELVRDRENYGRYTLSWCLTILICHINEK